MTQILGILAVPLGYALSGLYSLIGNYGISLIVLTLIVKLLLYPLYKKQILSMANLGDLTPKMNEIQNKYASDPQKMQEKMQELYQEEGASPTAGCLPMFIQMFIIMGLFALLRTPLEYINTDTMVFAIHESFLWINDLSQPDPWILPLLSGVATFGSFYMSQQNGMMNNPTMGAQGQGMQIAMKYVFPIMIIWLSKTYAAGLALYWFLSQFIQIFYNLRFSQLRKKIQMEKAEAKLKKRKPVRAGQGVR